MTRFFRRGKHKLASVLLSLVIILSVIIVFVKFPTEAFVTLSTENRMLSILAYTGLMFFSTVVAPFTTIGVVPLAATILGPFTTAVASIVGWVLGAIVAFLIARYGGRPFLSRFMDVGSLARYEAQIPQETHFLLLVMLRMAVPVDILSYALGLVSMVSLREYVHTTILGTLWFGFAFAYLGDAALSGNYVLLTVLGVASILVFTLAVLYVRKHGRQKTEDDH
jgi:uncharacterized membrane protein YdjX (TVP38/TMEM64 family)